MGLKLEVGNYYKTRDGRKVGPIRRTSQSLSDPWPFFCDFTESKTGLLYVRSNGETQSGMGDYTTPNLISEWTDAPTGPVRTDADATPMLTADNKRLREAGNALAIAAIHVADEYDGVHRLMLAVAEWYRAVANEGGRGDRA